MQYRVISAQVEDIHTGASFGPGEVAIGFDPDNPYDAAKLADEKFVAVAEPDGPEITDEARELAEQLGVDLEKVAGSGQNGRILIGDVQKASENQEAKS
jgi:pyruvate/2-oxoglutarate dehydrogenase complex dihydrolipoamide acyltransferase (E2) component